ncbi:uncharacterized protein LOC119678896 [Teleopsis dalmanni]|nr:uncharacterized protein LOC119678896 [Teleopsis dalmanni]
MSPNVANSTLNDFFNDSDSDGFLLEATQQIESKIHLPVTGTDSVVGCVISNCTELRDLASEANKTSTSIEKRSSLYEKFLEDDSPDDWFTSLDDVIEQAIQAKKPRNSLQRYKSMPTEASSLTIPQKTSKNVKSTKISPTIVQYSNPAVSRQTGHKSITTTTDVSKFKRHASSNTIPSGSR